MWSIVLFFALESMGKAEEILENWPILGVGLGYWCYSCLV